MFEIHILYVKFVLTVVVKKKLFVFACLRLKVTRVKFLYNLFAALYIHQAIILKISLFLFFLALKFYY